jgi:hypothetical protein
MDGTGVRESEICQIQEDQYSTFSLIIESLKSYSQSIRE